MTYEIYLRKGNEQRFLESIEAETMWPPPDRGGRWSLKIDGQEWPCEIVDVGDSRIGLDGRTLISQDVFVRRIGTPLDED